MYLVIFLLYYNVYLERTTTLRPREGVACRMIIFTYVTFTNNQTKQSCEAYTERISVNEIIREGVAFSQCLATVCLVLSLAAYPSGYCRNDNHTKNKRCTGRNDERIFIVSPTGASISWRWFDSLKSIWKDMLLYFNGYPLWSLIFRGFFRKFSRFVLLTSF